MKKIFCLFGAVILSTVLGFSQTQWVLQEYLHRIGKNANTGLGARVKCIGDINQDNRSAVAVSESTNTGIWYITNNTDTLPSRKFTGFNLTQGDINGDGYKDLVTRKPMQGGVSLDTVFIFLGTSTGIDVTADAILVGEHPDDRFGFSMAIGDLNANGIDDLVISALGYPNGLSEGKVYIYFGKSTFAGIPDLSFSGDTTLANLGVKCKIVDVDSDGIPDLVITGNDESHVSQISEWYNYLNVYYGGTSFDTISDFRLNGIPGRLAFAGLEVMDANADGVKDILWRYDDSVSQSVRIYFGRNQLDNVPDVILRAPSFTAAEFGYTIADAGDMDGDGYHDIAIADPSAFQGSGFMFIYRGGAALDAEWDAGIGRSDGSFFGSSIDTVGDINGDGLSDIIVGAPQYAFGTGQGYFGIFLGDRRITAVNEEPSTVPRVARLEQNYPNPFNPITTIGYELKSSALVTIHVYDMLGRDVATLVSEVKHPSRYQTEFDGSKLPSGVYYYRMTSIPKQGGIFTQTKKLLLVK